ncbi:MAG: M61 family peptidase [Bacteroidetes bacterium]|nr:MAG: M61 family peptidase [Bacteroidota bacterium]
MTKYHFSIENSNLQYIQISYFFQAEAGVNRFRLPSWRPGRYELGNFAKNVRNLKLRASAEKLTCHKVSKDCWEFEVAEAMEVQVDYQYYASELNAGSTYLDAKQLYVNPVNCCIYAEGHEDEACEVTLNVPDHYRVACSLPQEGKVMKAPNFDSLADAPWICSPDFQEETYEVEGVIFHLVFQGEVKVDWDRLKKDFLAFTSKQMEEFSEFPVREYYFLFQIVPYKAYHGVEHQHSTVILLGPSYDVFGSFYDELLGVSSHELYHTWNVKAIRPAEMYPYDFTKENYSHLGFLCEGVTTYQGDHFLFKSGVFSEQQYYKEFSSKLQRHFDNFARFNYSVAESSWDTWLDGYVAGAPGRKVSIYTEGALLAFVTDVFVMRHTKEKYGLDEVMKRLYFNYYHRQKGVTEADYKKVVEQTAGQSFDQLWEDYFFGTKPYESILTDAFEYLGLELKHEPVKDYSAGNLGLKVQQKNGKTVVSDMYPGGTAELGGLMLQDEVLAVNGMQLNENMDQWLNYFDEDQKVLTISRSGVLKEVILPVIDRHFYMKYELSRVTTPNQHQQRAFKKWIG